MSQWRRKRRKNFSFAHLLRSQWEHFLSFLCGIVFPDPCDETTFILAPRLNFIFIDNNREIPRNLWISWALLRENVLNIWDILYFSIFGASLESQFSPVSFFRSNWSKKKRQCDLLNGLIKLIPLSRAHSVNFAYLQFHIIECLSCQSEKLPQLIKRSARCCWLSFGTQLIFT